MLDGACIAQRPATDILPRPRLDALRCQYHRLVADGALGAVADVVSVRVDNGATVARKVNRVRSGRFSSPFAFAILREQVILPRPGGRRLNEAELMKKPTPVNKVEASNGAAQESGLSFIDALP